MNLATAAADTTALVRSNMIDDLKKLNMDPDRINEPIGNQTKFSSLKCVLKCAKSRLIKLPTILRKRC